MLAPRPGSTLFPYTTLFRSRPRRGEAGDGQGDGRQAGRRRELGERHLAVPGRRVEGDAARGDAAEAGEEAVSADVHQRSEEHTSELQSHSDLVCRLLLEKKK